MGEDNEVVVSDSESVQSDDVNYQTETVIYTDHLDQIIELQSLQITISIVLLGVLFGFFVGLVFNKLTT